MSDYWVSSVDINPWVSPCLSHYTRNARRWVLTVRNPAQM